MQDNKNLLNKKIGAFSLALLLCLSTLALFQKPKEVLENEPIEIDLVNLIEEVIEEVIIEKEDDDTVILVNEVLERIKNQEKVDAQIIAEVESGYYTPINPLVVLDPYSQSPLTALIGFTTDTPTRVEIHIPGDDYFTEANHSFSEITTQHIIPVYGLYADTLNNVVLSVYSDDNILETSVIEIQTEPLPDYLEELIIITETFDDGYQEGINYMYEKGKWAFDKNANIRWYYTDRGTRTPTEYNFSDNHFFLSKGAYKKGSIAFMEVDKIGKIYSVYLAPYGNHHELSLMSTGNVLAGGHSIYDNNEQAFAYEINIKTGEIENTMDFKYVIQRTRPAWGITSSEGLSNKSDWMHLNSIEYDENDGTIVVSSNYQSAVIKINWETNEIKWILGNHNDWNPRLQQYLLTPIGDDFEWQYNQHAAEILPDYDNNPDTIDILLFDNGSTRFVQDEELQRQIINNEIVEPELYSRMVHYRINEVTMEVEQIWQYGKERGLELYSQSRSDADLLENGNILGMFFNYQTLISKVSSPTLVEVNKNSDLIWEAEIFSNSSNGQTTEYRAERLPLYFEDDKEHDVYTKATNLIPQDVLDYVANY